MKTRLVIEIETDTKLAQIFSMDDEGNLDETDNLTETVHRQLHEVIAAAIEEKLVSDDDGFYDDVYERFCDDGEAAVPESWELNKFGLKITFREEPRE